MGDLNKLRDEIHENAKAHGWWDEERNFGELLQLVGDEVAEAHEEYRNHRGMTEVYYSGKSSVSKEKGFTVQRVYSSETPTRIDDVQVTKPEGIPCELADIMIRVLDMCGRYGIDIEKVLAEKHEFNKTRPYKHGNKRA